MLAHNKIAGFTQIMSAIAVSTYVFFIGGFVFQLSLLSFAFAVGLNKILFGLLFYINVKLVMLN